MGEIAREGRGHGFLHTNAQLMSKQVGFWVAIGGLVLYHGLPRPSIPLRFYLAYIFICPSLAIKVVSIGNGQHCRNTC